VPDLRTSVLAPGAFSGRPQPTIEEQGLVLRPWREEDAATLARAYADPDIRRWHLRSMDEDEALLWMRARHEMWQTDTAGDWVVIEGGEPAGRASVHNLDLREGSGEAGYWVLPEARGRGLATRALLALSGWLFEEAGLHRVELEHSTANPASCRVAEKAGFAAEGVKRRALLHDDGWHDMHFHERLREDAR
jgi:RimJ/RimL family protein N-acetyltransferase